MPKSTIDPTFVSSSSAISSHATATGAGLSKTAGSTLSSNSNSSGASPNFGTSPSASTISSSSSTAVMSSSAGALEEQLADQQPISMEAPASTSAASSATAKAEPNTPFTSVAVLSMDNSRKPSKSPSSSPSSSSTSMPSLSVSINETPEDKEHQERIAKLKELINEQLKRDSKEVKETDADRLTLKSIDGQLKQTEEIQEKIKEVKEKLKRQEEEEEEEPGKKNPLTQQYLEPLRQQLTGLERLKKQQEEFILLRYKHYEVTSQRAAIDLQTKQDQEEKKQIIEDRLRQKTKLQVNQLRTLITDQQIKEEHRVIQEALKKHRPEPLASSQLEVASLLLEKQVAEIEQLAILQDVEEKLTSLDEPNAQGIRKSKKEINEITTEIAQKLAPDVIANDGTHSAGLDGRRNVEKKKLDDLQMKETALASKQQTDLKELDLKGQEGQLTQLAEIRKAQQILLAAGLDLKITNESLSNFGLEQSQIKAINKVLAAAGTVLPTGRMTIREYLIYLQQAQQQLIIQRQCQQTLLRQKLELDTRAHTDVQISVSVLLTLAANKKSGKEPSMEISKAKALAQAAGKTELVRLLQTLNEEQPINVERTIVRRGGGANGDVMERITPNPTKLRKAGRGAEWIMGGIKGIVTLPFMAVGVVATTALRALQPWKWGKGFFSQIGKDVKKFFGSFGPEDEPYVNVTYSPEKQEITVSALTLSVERVRSGGAALIEHVSEGIAKDIIKKFADMYTSRQSPFVDENGRRVFPAMVIDGFHAITRMTLIKEALENGISVIPKWKEKDALGQSIERTASDYMLNSNEKKLLIAQPEGLDTKELEYWNTLQGRAKNANTLQDVLDLTEEFLYNTKRMTSKLSSRWDKRHMPSMNESLVELIAANVV